MALNIRSQDGFWRDQIKEKASCSGDLEKSLYVWWLLKSLPLSETMFSIDTIYKILHKGVSETWKGKEKKKRTQRAATHKENSQNTLHLKCMTSFFPGTSMNAKQNQWYIYYIYI